MLNSSEELKDTASRLQAIIDTAIDGIITIDSKGIIESMNKAAAAQFQYTAEEVIGKNVKILMSQPYRREHDQYIANYLETRVPKIIGIGREVSGLRKDGQSFPIRLAVSEVILNDRIIFTGIIHDLSSVHDAENNLRKLNKELEQKVAQRTEELEQAINKLLYTNSKLSENELLLTSALNKEKELNELKSRFVSMASHEFKTPLSTILSSASLIGRYSKAEQTEQRNKHVERIKSAINNLTGILNDFLSLSKIEEGKETVKIESFALEDVISNVIEELSGILRGSQRIVYDPMTINLISDKRILKNILFNLTSNAIKYSHEDGMISIETTQTEDFVNVKIVDSGIGIPEEEQKHLFTRFYRASNVENIPGTGLGLNIVQRYVELIGAKITYKSELGKGSEFCLSVKKEV